MRKMILCSIATVAMAFGAIFTSQKFEATGLTPTQLANIEALANGEGGGGNCHNQNGYRRWKIERPYWWSDKESFYDCCEVLCEGFSPSENCI